MGFDERNLPDNKTTQAGMLAISLEQATAELEGLKEFLIDKGEATDLFGKVRSDGLASALATIEQGFGDEQFYPNVAKRAAHLLYFVVKNHPFVDGNKRSGAFLFIRYLEKNEHLLARSVWNLINDNALVSITLHIAESQAEQKEMMIRLIENMILLESVEE